MGWQRQEDVLQRIPHVSLSTMALVGFFRMMRGRELLAMFPKYGPTGNLIFDGEIRISH